VRIGYCVTVSFSKFLEREFSMSRHFLTVALSAVAALSIFDNVCHAQIGYGVNGSGQLFRFFVNDIAPAPVTNIGAPLTFVPEGIDFRPSSQTLYAIDITPNTTQLYTIDINSGVATAVGAGFNSMGPGYDLTTSSNFGFDFNPKTLQGDNSMRIRLVNTANQNLRLNSSTGLIDTVDMTLEIVPSGNSPFVDAVAYINNIAEMSGPGVVTTLYDMDTRNDSLYTQSPPNDGDLNLVGAFGFSIDAITRVHFDIYTDPASVDSTIGGDTGYAVMKRPDAPIAPGPTGSYLLYNVNLATGQTLQGRLVGSAVTPANFDGGFAVLPFPVPEPSCMLLMGIAGLALASARRRR
jgi:hypothetical protein